jgi:hypothetical protein
MLISVVSIPVSVYLIVGLISPDLNLDIEHKIRKYFRRKSSVIFVDPRSYIRQRNTRLIIWSILIVSTSKLIIYVLFRSLSHR